MIPFTELFSSALRSESGDSMEEALADRGIRRRNYVIPENRRLTVREVGGV